MPRTLGAHGGQEAAVLHGLSFWHRWLMRQKSWLASNNNIHRMVVSFSKTARILLASFLDACNSLLRCAIPGEVRTTSQSSMKDGGDQDSCARAGYTHRIHTLTRSYNTNATLSATFALCMSTAATHRITDHATVSRPLRIVPRLQDLRTRLKRRGLLPSAVLKGPHSEPFDEVERPLARLALV